MKYAKSYIDKLFESIGEYHSKIELLSITFGEFQENKEAIPDWIVELGEIMNWQAMSDRSGVWTYYEVIYINRANVIINKLKSKNEIEILEKYVKGINDYSNEDLMDEIDIWIIQNEYKIYRYIEEILIENKGWFYRDYT